MSLWASILQEAAHDKSYLVVIALMLTALVQRIRATARRAQLKRTALIAALHGVLVCVAGWLHTVQVDPDLLTFSRLASLVPLVMLVASMVSQITFDLLLPVLKVSVSSLFQDFTFGVCVLAGIVAVATQLGISPSQLFATSAVLTAVLGLALQDTLGTLAASILLQTDGAISIGDLIRVGDITGRVSNYHWRYTAIETEDSTVLVPNSQLTKEVVTLLGHRAGRARLLRHELKLRVPARYLPTEVSRAVICALSDSPIEGLAPEPSPECVLTDVKKGDARYTLTLWLSQADERETLVDRVWTRILFGLRREGISLDGGPERVRVTRTSRAHRQRRTRRELEERVRALSRVTIFSSLPEAELRELAKSLRHMPFAQGEYITKQGSSADCLFTLIRGRVSVRVSRDGLEQEAVRLGENDFFGEMSLMTGEPRAATIVALTDVDCYRLDKGPIQKLMQRQPALAGSMAQTLVQRRGQNAAVREGLDAEAQALRLASEKNALLSKIQDFFRLGADAA